MPRTRRVSRTRWKDAVRYVGSERELIALARADSTLSNWRKLGVPADVLFPYMERHVHTKTSRAPGKMGSDEVRQLREFARIMAKVPGLADVLQGLALDPEDRRVVLDTLKWAKKKLADDD